MVAEASGCCASALSAVATDRPSPSAGAMHPRPIVRPAVTIEAMATRVMLSIVCPLADSLLFHALGAGIGLRVRVAAAMYTAARMLKI